MTADRRIALVTGGTGGIGKEIARGLARAGMRVVVVGRDAARGARAAEELRNTTGNTTGNPAIDFIAADLGLVHEATRVADELSSRYPALHCLVHSAGIVRGRYQATAEGIESNLAVNYLSRFVLTRRLLPLLEGAARPGRAARIVAVSGAAQQGRIYFDDVNLTANFSTLRAIAQSCRMNDVFTVELARRLRPKTGAPPVTVSCLKIGVVKTGIRREFPLWMKWLVPLVFDPLLGQTPQEAAAPALELLLAPEFEGVTGALFLKIRKFKQIAASAAVRDAETAARLWALSERLVSNASGHRPETGQTRRGFEFRNPSEGYTECYDDHRRTD